jgi:nitrogen fixation protein FixH
MSGRQVFWYFLVFFCFIAAVNAIMVTYALHTHSGVVTEHTYEKGLAYNKVIEAEEEQEALGWKGTISYKDGLLQFTLVDADGAPIRPKKITATITRPIQIGMDFVLDIDGEETPIDFPANGLWEIRIDVIHEGLHYQQSRRIIVP